jgi:hypothetical protein
MTRCRLTRLDKSKCWRYQYDAGRVMVSPLLAPDSVCLRRAINLGKLSKSTSLPERSSATGYSLLHGQLERMGRLDETYQSRSMPSKPYVAMNDNSDSMKIFCLGTDAERSEKVVAVGPGSLKAQPPTAM